MKKLLLITSTCLLLFSTARSQNLVTNPGFEANVQPNAQGWHDNCGPIVFTTPDTVCAAGYSTDVPPGGNMYSMVLNAQGNMGPAFAETYVTGQTGNNIYTLNVWMKQAGAGNTTASLVLISNSSSTVLKSMSVTSTSWMQHTLVDTLSISAGDTLAVRFDAAAGGPAFVDLYIDLVDLQQTGAVSIGEQSILETLQLFPNPFGEQATLITNENDCTFTLYNCTGEKIREQEFSGSLMISKSDLAPGIYYYRVNAGMKRGSGKLIVQ